jgi:hypothetical protein
MEAGGADASCPRIAGEAREAMRELPGHHADFTGFLLVEHPVGPAEEPGQAHVKARSFCLQVPEKKLSTPGRNGVFSRSATRLLPGNKGTLPGSLE